MTSSPMPGTKLTAAATILLLSTLALCISGNASWSYDKAPAEPVQSSKEACKIRGDVAEVTSPDNGQCVCPNGTLLAGEVPLGPLANGRFFCSPNWKT